MGGGPADGGSRFGVFGVVDGFGFGQPHLLPRVLEQLQRRPGRTGRLDHRLAQLCVRGQHAAVAVLVDAGRSDQVCQTIQQLQRRQDQFGAAVERGDR